MLLPSKCWSWILPCFSTSLANPIGFTTEETSLRCERSAAPALPTTSAPVFPTARRTSKWLGPWTNTTALQQHSSAVFVSLRTAHHKSQMFPIPVCVRSCCVSLVASPRARLSCPRITATPRARSWKLRMLHLPSSKTAPSTSWSRSSCGLARSRNGAFGAMLLPLLSRIFKARSSPRGCRSLIAWMPWRHRWKERGKPHPPFVPIDSSKNQVFLIQTGFVPPQVYRRKSLVSSTKVWSRSMSKHLLDLFPFLSAPAGLNHFNQLWLFCVNYTTLSSHPQNSPLACMTHMYYIWPYLFCHLKVSCNYVSTTYLIYTIEKKQKNVPVKSGILCVCPRPWIITLPDIQEHHTRHSSGASKELFTMLSKQNKTKQKQKQQCYNMRENQAQHAHQKPMWSVKYKGQYILHTTTYRFWDNGKPEK